MISDYSIAITHDYNVVVIYLTDDIGDEIPRLVGKLNEIQLKNKNVLTEVKLTHYKNRVLEGEEQVKLLDLIRMYCSEFDGSSVFIFGEEVHCKDLMKLFKLNPNYIKSNSLIKFITKNGTPIVLRED